MAGEFVNTSSQRLVNTAPQLPSTGYPWSCGLWVYPTTTGTQRTLVSLTDTAVTNHGMGVAQGAANAWNIFAQAGGTVNFASVGTVTANRWAYVVGRFISATNRRIAILQYDGTTAATQSTTNRGPSSLDALTLGANELSTPADFFGGRLAEFWYADSDIQPDGAALNTNLLRQLAMRGPFSIPSLAHRIVEYRSLRSALNRDRPDEVYSRGTRASWNNTNGVTIGAHPPLSGSYRRPLDTTVGMMVV